MTKTWRGWAVVVVVVIGLCSAIALTLVKTGVIGGNVAGVAKPTSKPPTKVVSGPKYVDITAAQVKSGDTLTNIASRNGLTLAQIAKLNPQIHNLNLIFPKQKIRVR